MTPPAPIVIVSGLPRSGTSLVMQMLQTGGAPLLVDSVRPADADNPRGYFEYEPVKRLRFICDWMPTATGKALKVISPLLAYLPGGYAYHIILVERDLREVVASQQSMLVRTNRAGASLSQEELVLAFERKQAEVDTVLAGRRDFRLLRLQHRQLLLNPAAETLELAQFVATAWPKIPLDLAAMAAVVEPPLYRHRLNA